jgi:hypothetical protein
MPSYKGIDGTWVITGSRASIALSSHSNYERVVTLIVHFARLRETLDEFPLHEQGGAVEPVQPPEPGRQLHGRATLRGGSGVLTLGLQAARHASEFAVIVRKTGPHLAQPTQ